jgi:hypothetical protein
MWPFKKKPEVQSFQEFRRTYVPPAYYPFCPDCSSEGIELQVVPLAEFLATTTAEGLDDLLMRWEAIDGFLSAFKDLKSRRIRHLLALKLGGA